MWVSGRIAIYIWVVCQISEKLEDTLSNFGTSIESIDGEGFDVVETKDGVDSFMFCSPRYFEFNEGMYDLMVNDLLGYIKGTIESLKDASKSVLLMMLAWRCIKAQRMLKI